MRRFLGCLTWGVSIGVLLASIGAGEVKAGPAYAITVSITDNTTSTTTVFNIPFASPLNTSINPNQIVVSGAFNTDATGVGITGLQANTTSSAAVTSLEVQGTATLQDATTDNYTIQITAGNNGFTQPAAAPSATISQSESGTFTFTGAGGTQTFNSWYNASNVPAASGPNPGLQTIPIPVTGMTTLSGSQNAPGSVTTSPYTTPYALTNQITIHISGTGATGANSIVGFQGSTTLVAVPEPASLVMFLTGMPMPLMVLGMLRRRKAQRKTDLVA